MLPTKDTFIDLTDYEIDQIWAELYYYYQQGEDLDLPKHLKEEAVKHQQAHTQENEKKGLIEDYLDLDLPECWDSMDIWERQNYIHNKEDRADKLEQSLKAYKREKVCVAEIWCELLRGNLKDMTGHNTKELHDVMRNLEGWEEGKQSRFTIYGKQKSYKKCHTNRHC